MSRPHVAARSLRLLRRSAFGACVLFTLPLGAQSAQRWSIQGSLIGVGVSGDAYAGLDAGSGGELQLRFTPGRFSIGAGGQLSSHNVSDGDFTASFGEQSISLRGFFVEPRFVFDVGSDRFAPYAAARLATLQQSLKLDGVTASGDDLELTASGTQLNVGGGALFRLTPRLNLDVGATYGAIDFDDAKASSGGQSMAIDGTSGSGKNFVIRVGLAIGLR